MGVGVVAGGVTLLGGVAGVVGAVAGGDVGDTPGIEVPAAVGDAAGVFGACESPFAASTGSAGEVADAGREPS